jgi:signal peptidase I
VNVSDIRSAAVVILLPQRSRESISRAGWLRNTLGSAQTLITAVLIALVFRSFLFEPFNIPSGSMEPTLDVGDYIFVSKFAYGYSNDSFPFEPPLFSGRILFRPPHRGDVVVFKLPADNTTDYIKRIVGLPGDRLQVRDGLLYVNDAPVRHQYLGTYPFRSDWIRISAGEFLETLPNGVSHRILQFSDEGPLDNTPVFVVPPGHYFVMGDNRDDSADSRDPTSGVGFVPAENLEGRADLIFFSIGMTSPVWEFWNWPFEVRWGRLFSGID